MKNNYIIKYVAENLGLIDYDDHCEYVKYTENVYCTPKQLCNKLSDILNKFSIIEINIEKLQ